MAANTALWADVLRWLVNGYLVYGLACVGLDRADIAPAGRTLPYLGLTALGFSLLPAGWPPARAVARLYPLAPKPVLVALYLLAGALLLWPLARRWAGDRAWGRGLALLALAGWSGSHLLLGGVAGAAGALAWAPPLTAALGGLALLRGRDGPRTRGLLLLAVALAAVLAVGAQAAVTAATRAEAAAAGVDPRALDSFKRALANGSHSPAFGEATGGAYYHYTDAQLLLFDPLAYGRVRIEAVQPLRFQPAPGQWRDGLLLRYRLGAVAGRALVAADGSGRWVVQVEHDG